MPVEITVPRLGESILEAVVGKWNKKEGDPVRADEPLVVLETDKVTVEVPAPSSGVLARIAHAQGETVKVGEVIGAIDESARAAAAPAPRPLPAAEERAGVLLSPVAKRLVEERGLDATQIQGTGPSGRILKEDVLSHVEGAAAKGNGAMAAVQAPAAPRIASAPRPAGERPRALREERVRMTPLRKRVAERLLAAQSNAAILTTFNEVDMGQVMALRKEYQERFQAKHGIKLGIMSFFVRACIEALKAFPALNAEIDGEDVIFKHYYDIGVAVAGSRGLVVPVVRDADRLGLAAIESQVAELGNKARTDKLTLDDLQGGTFTISNGGIFGSMLSTPILNPPQTGILGMHAIQERPVARGGQIVVRPMMYLALSYDHRLVDGREAVLFLVRVKECIEDPQRLLLEV